MEFTKEEIELSAINAAPGILPKDTKFESYIGHNVINLSNVQLSTYQLSALEKGLTFCPSPGAPDKSQIWEDFKNSTEDWNSCSSSVPKIKIMNSISQKVLLTS